MNILIPQILHDLWRHKLRSSLAIFCIAFGTYIMSMLMALGTGFCERSKHDLMDIAGNSMAVWQRATSKSYRGYPKGQTNRITIADVIALPKVLPSIEMVSPMLNKSATLSYMGKAYMKGVWGVTADHVKLAKLKIATGGRFFIQIDVERQARVAVISNKVKQVFFGKNGNALGAKFLIDGVSFTIIGVLADDEKNKLDRDEDVFISYKSYQEMYGDKYIEKYFFVVTKPNVSTMQAEQILRSYFAGKYNFDKNDKEAMGFWGSSKIQESISWYLLGIQIFLSVCGMMVLAVGSLGVANIMFLIVAERTYEIGLRKAIGATDQQIFLQIFLEVLVIAVVGGIIGLASVFLTTTFLQHITLPAWIGAPKLSWLTAAIAFLVLALIELVTGFFPARRAAKMDPIEALLT